MGKADLPINHVHVYFPVQVVHKLVERCRALGLQDVTPEEGKRYKRNSENETNNPYIIVIRAYEGQCVSENYPTVPPTLQLARAYEQGILDGSFGQMISFASSYKSSFRLEVPAWNNVEEGMAHQEDDQSTTAPLPMAKPVLPMCEQSPEPRNNILADASAAPVQEGEEDEAAEETYLVPTGQGCFSFQRGLLQRAAQTYSKRSV